MAKGKNIFIQNNQLWKLRSKHGRDKLFATPELLREAAGEYFEYCDTTPVLKEDYVGGFATRVLRQMPRPYTLAGLCIYVGASRHWWNEFRKHATPDFLEVIHEIEEMIWNQKFEGATAGVFNANIISRDLGLVDKTDVKTSGDQKVTVFDYSKLSDGALEEIAKAGTGEGEG